MDQSVVLKEAELFFKMDLHKKEQTLAKKNVQIEAERKQVTRSKQIYAEVKYQAKNLFMHLLKKPKCAMDNGIFLVECVSNLIKVHSEPGLPDFWDGFLVEEKEFLVASAKLKIELEQGRKLNHLGAIMGNIFMKKHWDKSGRTKTLRDVMFEPAVDYEVVGSDGGDEKMSQDSSILGEDPQPKPKKDIFEFQIPKNNYLTKGKCDATSLRQKLLEQNSNGATLFQEKSIFPVKDHLISAGSDSTLMNYISRQARDTELNILDSMKNLIKENTKNSKPNTNHSNYQKKFTISRQAGSQTLLPNPTFQKKSQTSNLTTPFDPLPTPFPNPKKNLLTCISSPPKRA
jgi:hypothetical protein